MNRQPDKLFRDKLQGYQRTVSPEAWKKISHHLHRNNNRLWLKIAASILLLASAGVWIFSDVTQHPVPVLSEKTLPSEKQLAEDSEKIIPNESDPATDRQRAAGDSPLAGPSAKTPVQKKAVENVKPAPAQLLKKIPKDEVPPVAVHDIESPIPEVEQKTEDQLSETPGSSSQTIKQNAGVTIVYSAKEVNEKYLNKKTIAEATSEGKGSSAFRKLLDKAYDLKHNQDPLGDLRHMKNEILALNFKNDKQRGENE